MRSVRADCDVLPCLGHASGLISKSTPGSTGISDGFWCSRLSPDPGGCQIFDTDDVASP